MNTLHTMFLVFLSILNTASVYSFNGQGVPNRLSDHTAVTDSDVFPYVVAILKKQSYLSAGALLDERWVLTAADALYLVGEATRLIRVRLGSINYKKGGTLVPVQAVFVHPQYVASKPARDVALVRLGQLVWMTRSLYPIRLQTWLREVTATHFIITAWTPSMKVGKRPRLPISIDTIKQQRILSVSHLHPQSPDLCTEELAALDITQDGSIMCLDSDFKTDSCWRDVGAPVVLNGVLWGIISSFRTDDCRTRPGTNFVSLVAAPDIRSWIHATTHGHKWNATEYEDTSAREKLGPEDVLSKDEDTNEI